MNLLRQKKGKTGEAIARNYLIGKGHSIIYSNYRVAQGEIDIISKKDKTVYFVEVKTRQNPNRGMPYEAIDSKKINRIKTAAKYFLLQNRFKNYKLKIALISVLLDDKKIDVYDNIAE